MDIYELLDTADPRKPLLTVGEAHAVLALLRQVVDGEGQDAVAADELAVRLAQRVPAPPE
ncbi:hypothetical protein [Streptomyces zhihengii]|uniref:Uncharacterized protein n=1 Tax=Streptomyces zhihengii TaxID=1818004 RepID=A0ABS2V2E6_9ACTN|nr:hypothetical protein [Streptomyces zhihengii]MBM9623996.1 hypothetical protein [Streptomyces zhihengii]